MGASPSSQRLQLLLPFLNDEDEPPRILVLGMPIRLPLFRSIRFLRDITFG